MSNLPAAFNASYVLAVIQRQLEKQYRCSWEYSPYVEFMGSMTADQTLRGQWPSGTGKGKPIVMIDNPFVWKGKDYKAGGNHWERGERQAQVDAGKSGDTSIGSGVMPSLMHTEGYVNQKRFIIRIRSGHMNQQNLDGWGDDIFNNGAPELYDKANRYASLYGIRDALHKGYSRHITGSGEGEFGVAVRWHPDFCVPGLQPGRGTGSQMFTTWSATTATFQSALAKKVAQVSNAVEHQMSVSMLEKLAVIARRRIRPLMVLKGLPLFS